MSGQLWLPAHGESTIAEILPGLAAHLRPGLAGAVDVIGLPAAHHYVLVLVDGLGFELLNRHRDRVPYLGDLCAGAKVLTSAIPSTTATSLTTLGTGLAPGQHGLVGYEFRYEGALVNALHWDDRTDPLTVQPKPTWFEQLAQAGVLVSSVAPAHFETTGLTRAGLRGPRFVGIGSDQPRTALIEATVQAATSGEASLVYVYERDLDHAGHTEGCGSVPWRRVLDEIDEYLELLRAALPADVCLLITGDHGMVDIPESNRLVVEDIPGLTSGVDLMGGDGRLRQLYTSRPDEVAERWAQCLGSRALVRTRQQTIDEGWWGQVDDVLADRIGDVLVAMLDDWAMMSLAMPRQLSLVGQHGSLTAAEMRVPLLMDFDG